MSNASTVVANPEDLHVSLAKERPILFSALMVRAIMSGAKTQTRRLVVPGRGQAWLTPGGIDSVRRFAPSKDGWWTMAVGEPRRIVHCGIDMDGGHIGSVRCPYGVPGDRLWVRETFALVWPTEDPPENERDNEVQYRADWPNDKYPGHWPDDCADDPACSRWKPSIYMPRWASRITLEITGVRVERLQDISDEDARAEGVGGTESQYGVETSAVDEYRALWEQINGKRCPWGSNSWVWALSFKRV